MNIDLVYYFREVNHYYYLNGPEKVNGNIVNNSPSYQLSSVNDVVIKINQMIASLAPDITNVGLVTSELYTGDIQVNTYRGELNVSSVPDYTNVLTSINTNLTNLNSKFVGSDNRNIVENLRLFASAFTSDLSSDSSSFNKSLIRFLGCLSEASYNDSYSTIINYSNLRILHALTSSYASSSNQAAIKNGSFVRAISELLKQSASPNASITDVISSLNTNIHNDLTNINTTTENKDTVLLIDGQQEFKLRNKEEMEF